MTLPYSLTLSPLYTVRFGPLTFKAWECFLIGDGEVRLVWTAPNGAVDYRTKTMAGGTSFTVNAFASTWRDVGADSPLQYPWVRFLEYSVDGPQTILNELDPSQWVDGLGGDDPGYQLLIELGKSTAYDAVINNLPAGPECQGEVSYSQSYTLETFSQL